MTNTLLVTVTSLLFIGCTAQVTANRDSLSPNPSDSLACNSCHGSGENLAPPKDTAGNEVTTEKGVGAHQAHMSSGKFHDGVSCGECHLVPTEVSSAGHIDSDLPSEVIFGEVSTVDGFSPSWNGTTCSQVYCHGATIGGGTLTEPNWTQVDGSQAFCGSCHGIPPPAPHVQQQDCHTCHGDVVDADKNIIDKNLHVNGQVNTTGSGACNSCHGSSSNNAPPLSTTGSSLTSDRGVGAHQSHVRDTSLHKAFVCNSCHIVPSAVDSAGHRDTVLPAEVTFGAIAITGNVAPTWNGTTCANSYCHGNFIGGNNFSPTWTTVDGSQTACASCHNISPSTGDHRRDDHRNLPCSRCHGTGYSSTTVRAADHVNGQKNVGGAGSSITAWNAANRRCTPTCHGAETW